MRIPLRSLTFVAATLLASCAIGTPAFAQASDPTAAATSTTKTPSPPMPQPPAVVSADIVVEDTKQTVDEIIEDWFARHFHGLGGRLDEFLLNHLRAAADDLKRVLGAGS